MKYVLAFVLGIWGTLLATEVEFSLAKQPTDYSDTSSFAYHDENRCKSTGNFFDINIEVVYPSEMEDAVGRWVARNDEIELELGRGSDIDTIAHEVHHMVDTMMDRYNVKDDHYAAWLQGSFTRCVMEIVEEDLKKLK